MSLIANKLKELGVIPESASDENTAKLIQNLKKKIGDIPKDYEDFLFEFSAGIGFHGIEVIFTPKEDTKMNEYDSLSIDNLLGLVGNFNIFTDLDDVKDEFGDEWLEIGNDLYSNKLLLNLKGNKKGQIWFWDHEAYEDEDDDQISGLILVADSFSEFINKLEEYAIPYKD